MILVHFMVVIHTGRQNIHYAQLNIDNNLAIEESYPRKEEKTRDSSDRIRDSSSGVVDEEEP